MARSPGIYTKEIDRSHTAASIPGSIGAVVIDSDRGPIGPTLITSPRRFIENFGEPKEDTPAKYSALEFIRNADELWVRRVRKDGDEEASVEVEDEEGNTVFTVYAENPGTWGNDLSIFLEDNDEDEDLFNIHVFENNEEVESWVVSLDSDKKDGFGQPAYIEDVINGNSIYIRVEDEADKDGTPSSMRIKQKEEVSFTESEGEDHDYEIAASELDIVLEDIDQEERIVVRVDGTRGKNVEVDTENDVIKFDEPEDNEFDTSNDAEIEYWRKGETLDLSGGELDEGAIESADLQEAWDDFYKEDEYQVRILINGGYAIPGVQNKMIDLAEHRQDCIAVLDVPESADDAESIVEYSDDTLNANTSWAALYCGWPLVSDQFTGKRLYLPPSGFAAATMSRTDSAGEVWYAPAGFRRGVLNVLGVNAEFTQGDRDIIYRSNVNPIVEFSGQGTVIWGQKTLLRQASALDRINVRQLLIKVMNTAERTLQPFIFELNNERTRSNIESILDDYMTGIQQRGGVYDFKVQCDSENNPPRVIDNNEMNVGIYLQPTRVAEVINLSAIITRTGVDFE